MRGGGGGRGGEGGGRGGRRGGRRRKRREEGRGREGKEGGREGKEGGRKGPWEADIEKDRRYSRGRRNGNESDGRRRQRSTDEKN